MHSCRDYKEVPRKMHHNHDHLLTICYRYDSVSRVAEVHHRKSGRAVISNELYQWWPSSNLDLRQRPELGSSLVDRQLRPEHLRLLLRYPCQ